MSLTQEGPSLTRPYLTADAPLRGRPSLIPNAGHGLFTASSLPANAVVEGCTYGGRVMSLMEARCACPSDGVTVSSVPARSLARVLSSSFLRGVRPTTPFPPVVSRPCRRRCACKDYVMALHFNVHVDAGAHLGYLARYVNDNLEAGGAMRNCRFVKDVAGRTARVETTRAVEAGEELYAEYGDSYWRAREAAAAAADGDAGAEGARRGNDVEGT